MYDKIQFSKDSFVGTYAICVTVGIVGMFLLFLYRARKKEKYPEDPVYFAMQMLLISFVIGFIFSLVFDALFKIPDNHGFILNGVTFYGALIGGVIAFAIIMAKFKHKTGIRVMEWLNILAPSVVLAHFFGRIGCFLAGCCYGAPTDSWLGVIFPPGSPASEKYGIGVKVYPTELFEAFALLVILVVLVKFVKNNHFYIYLISYGVARFIIEFFRGDFRGSLFGPLSPAQMISLTCILFAITMLAIQHKKSVKLKMSYMN